jgi:hypothetical protein
MKIWWGVDGAIIVVPLFIICTRETGDRMHSGITSRVRGRDFDHRMDGRGEENEKGVKKP